MEPVRTDMTPRELRNFGLVTAVMLVLFFDILIPWIWGIALPVWPLIAASVLVLMALLVPKALGPVYIVWMKFANVLGWVNTRIILGLIFYVIFMPVGLVVRALSDPMRRKSDDGANSYREESRQPKIENMERPY
ncbi:MAG: sxtJ [Halioglobus sp.]|nr:sxtJ [Halioglobus sp.]